MNNLSSYCGLVDAKISAYDKDLPVLCIIAVRKDWGLKNPGSQTEAGKLKSEVQASNSLIRKIKSAYQFDSPFSDA